jgi:hypothetical protein
MTGTRPATDRPGETTLDHLLTVLAAPAAGAEVTEVRVAAGPEGLRIGCSYTVTAAVDAPPSEAGEVRIINSGGAIPSDGVRLGQD